MTSTVAENGPRTQLEAMSAALLLAVAHDIRTPLTSMRLAIDGLTVDGLSEDERVELVHTADASAVQLQRLIDDLLDLSRLESRLRHPMRTCRLDEVLPAAIEGTPPGAVRLNLPTPAPLVATDPRLLVRAVANLVSNAVRHSSGTTVWVRADVHRNSVDVVVADRGPGVPAHQRSAIFEPFQRLGDTTPGGLGLGLAVARGLTEAVGGTLSATDTPGGGLTMLLSLPRRLVRAS